MKRLALIIGIIITTFAIGCFCKTWAEDFRLLPESRGNERGELYQ